MCLFATRRIAEGEELKLTYGHDYWLSKDGGTVPPYSTAVLRAADDTWKRQCRHAVAQLRTRYAEESELLSALMSEDDLRELLT